MTVFIPRLCKAGVFFIGADVGSPHNKKTPAPQVLETVANYLKAFCRCSMNLLTIRILETIVRYMIQVPRNKGEPSLCCKGSKYKLGYSSLLKLMLGRMEKPSPAATSCRQVSESLMFMVTIGGTS